MITHELADSLAGLLFPRKLWILANTPDVESIKWGKLGTTVLINSVLVEKECFKPNVFNVQSNQHVLRQMSYYNFQKIDRKCKIWEFKHEHFQAGKEELLYLVKRQPQGVPKKFIEDVERRHSSRLQRLSMKGDRPNYARMEKGTLDSDGELEQDRRSFPRIVPKKRPYHRRNRSLEIKTEKCERPRGSSRGRGSRGGGRGKKRARQNRFDEINQNQVFSNIPGDEDSDTKDGNRLFIDIEHTSDVKELEYIVPNAANWFYNSLQSEMDGLTLNEGGKRTPGGENMQFTMTMELPEDDKTHLKHVVESTERAMESKRLQESSLTNDWSQQVLYGTRVQPNPSNLTWNSPDVNGSYIAVSEGNDCEMYNNLNNYQVFTPNNSCIPYGGPNFCKSLINFNLTLPPGTFQYGSSPADNVLCAKMPPSSEFLTSFSEFSGVEGKQDNNHRTMDAFEDVYRSPIPPSYQTHNFTQMVHQKTTYTSEIPIDYVTLDHNYNTIKDPANNLETLEATLYPLDPTIQNVMLQHDSYLSQLLDEQSSRKCVDGSGIRNSVESLAEPLRTSNSPQGGYLDKASEQQNFMFDSTQKSNEEQEQTNSSGSMDDSCSIDPGHSSFQVTDCDNSSSEKVQNGSNAESPSKGDDSDAKAVAYFLLDNTKYKKYSFEKTERGDILIKNCGEDFDYWNTNKDLNPQTLIASPCLEVNQ